MENILSSLKSQLSFKDDPEDYKLASSKLNEIQERQKRILKSLNKFQASLNEYSASWKEFNSTMKNYFDSAHGFDNLRKEMGLFHELQDQVEELHSSAMRKSLLEFFEYLQSVEDQTAEMVAIRKEAKKVMDLQFSTSKKIQSGSDTKGVKFDKLRRELQSHKEHYEQEISKLNGMLDNMEKLEMLKLSELMINFTNGQTYCADTQQKVAKKVQDQCVKFKSKLGASENKLVKHIEEQERYKNEESIYKRGTVVLVDDSLYSKLFGMLEAPQKDIVLFSGESLLIKSDQTIIKEGINVIVGIFYITDYRCVFITYKKRLSKVKVEDSVVLFDIPHGMIEYVENIGDSQGLLTIGTKDLRSFALSFRHAVVPIEKCYDAVKQKSMDYLHSQPFAFKYKSSSKVNGWGIFDLVKEYERIGFPDQNYDIAKFNEKYAISPTYPEYVVIPNSLENEGTIKAYGFRTKSRGVAIVWKYPGSKGQVLARCSQPKVGILKKKRNPEDELLVKSLGRNNSQSSEDSKSLLIIDARPRVNAVGNAVVKGGYESTAVYKSVNFEFAGIANIHVVREAFTGIRDIINSNMYDASSNSRTFKGPTSPKNSKSDANSIIERYRDIILKLKRPQGVKAKWLVLIGKILKGAIKIVESMHTQQISVLIHCSDGWDRTSQLCSLAEIMMDPFYRTMTGFMILIEKEWISFGHKFGDRCGHGENRDPFDKQRSPIFIQWVDSVFQIVLQKPSAFEFNTDFLVDIIDAAYSCKYGNFLFNSDKERSDLNIKKTTVSLWSDMLANSSLYTNPSYKPTSQVLKIDIAHELTLFLPFFRRWDEDISHEILPEILNGISRKSDLPSASMQFDENDDEKGLDIFDLEDEEEE